MATRGRSMAGAGDLTYARHGTTGGDRGRRGWRGRAVRDFQGLGRGKYRPGLSTCVSYRSEGDKEMADDKNRELIRLCRGIFETRNLIGTDFDDVQVLKVDGRDFHQQPGGDIAWEGCTSLSQ